MASIASQGYILRRIEFSESSLILHVLRRQGDLLTLMAKGARRPNSRLRGILQPFTLLQFIHPDHSRSEIRTLTDLSLIEDHSNLKGNPLASAMGSLLGEITLRYHPPGDVHEGLFESIRRAFQTMPGDNAFGQVENLLKFLLQFCEEAGFHFEARFCVLCQNPQPLQWFGLHPHPGGLVCMACKNSFSARFSVDNLLWLKDLENNSSLSMPSLESGWRMSLFLLHYLGEHFGGLKTIRSLQVYEDLAGLRKPE